MALAGLDMAAWDALAKASELSLVRLLGGERRPIPAYASFFLSGVDGAIRDAETALAGGFKALKIKVGYPDVQTDLAAIRAVREVVGEEVALMVDYNQSLSVPEAISRIRLLDEVGVYWVEEPTLYDDFVGHAHIRSQVKTPIQIGENWWGPHDMTKSIAAEASDFVMPDVMKIGGVTGWLRASALAEVHGLPVSSHLFQEISAHLLAITPTAAWLEQLDLANSILQQPLTFDNGSAIIPETAGNGLSWDEVAIAKIME
jgi:mandelate racemase